MDEIREDPSGAAADEAREPLQASRRKFLEASLAAGAVGLLGVPHAAAQATTPKRGGVLKLAVPSAARRLDPAIHGANEEFIISQAIFNNLVRVDPKLNPQPELASDWKVSEDGKSWTFNLRRGVKFHHGREFTSKDVEFTINRLLDPATASMGRSLFGLVQKIETPGPYVVKFDLSDPYADFPMMFGAVYARILPFDAAADVAKTPIGTGPFKMKEFVPADHVTMVRNTDYWEKDAAGIQLPYVDEFRQVTIPEQAAQIAALTSGFIHILWEAPPTSIATLKGDPNVKVLETPSPGYHEITIWVDKPPFSDQRVMQALKISLDRDQLIKAALGGYGTPSNDNPISSISPFWVDTGMKKRDLAKAKALMTEAGFGEWRRRGTHHHQRARGPGRVRRRREGNVGARGLPHRHQDRAVRRLHRALQPQAPVQHAELERPADHRRGALPLLPLEGQLQGAVPLQQQGSGQLLDDGRKEADLKKRKDMYGRVQKILSESGPVVIPYHRPYMAALHKGVQGYEIHPIRWADVRRTWLIAG